MTTILTVKYQSDVTGTEFVWIKEQNGSYIACTHTGSKWFSTLNGAKRYLRKFGYDVR